MPGNIRRAFAKWGETVLRQAVLCLALRADGDALSFPHAAACTRHTLAYSGDRRRGTAAGGHLLRLSNGTDDSGASKADAPHPVSELDRYE